MDGKRTLTVDDVLDALAEEYSAMTLRDDEFTISQFAKRINKPVGVAMRWLDGLVIEGRAAKRRISDGKAQWAYRMLD